MDNVKTPHKRWGGNCFTIKDDKGSELVHLSGGMDPLFLPHSNTDILDPLTLQWSKGPPLPQALTGAEGVLLEDTPTLFGGFNGIGFSKKVNSFTEGGWESLKFQMDSSRISGLAVAVPSNVFDLC